MNILETMDSRDIIERIEELLEDSELSCEEVEELKVLQEIKEEFECYGDWEHGEAVIPENEWLDYVKELVEECYELNLAKHWPYTHLAMDWEGAADELLVDYAGVEASNGTTYLMRA